MYPLQQIPSEAQIKKLVRKILFGVHMHCPRCKSRKVVKSEERYRCKQCRRPFSLTSHTWLSNMKFSWQTFYAILWSWLNNISIQQTIALRGVSEVSIRDWYEKFRVNIPDKGLLAPFEGGIIQMDEAYFKGISLIAAKDVIERKVRMRVVARASVAREHALGFITTYVPPSSLLCTDGSGIYRGIERYWPVRHQKDIHKKWEFGVTSEIEGMFGVFRTFVRRKYHHVTRSKFPFVVAEFQAKFNHPEMFQNPQQYLTNSLHLVPTR